MGLQNKPEVKTLDNGGLCWAHTYDRFEAKVYVPSNDLNGKVNDYSFQAPLLIILEENKMSMDEAVKMAEDTGLARIAASFDSSVVFVYPTAEGGWADADESLYIDLIAEVRIDPLYHEGMAEVHNFFTKNFDGYFIRGAKFRADVYGFGASADYIAKNLIKKIDGEFLWGPGEITPAMCSMQNLSVEPAICRKDIAILSVGNTKEINDKFKDCEHLLIKDNAEYEADFKSFVRKFKMWCGDILIEPDLEKMGMVREAGSVMVKTSPDQRGRYVGTKGHAAGYFAFYNKGLLDNGPVPLVLGFHGGGDSALYITHVSEWYKVAHDYNFLYIAFDDHLSLPATEIMDALEQIKRDYPIDEQRIYASGFSMGSGKTWDMFAEYPDVFAGLAPCSALFPMKDNWFGMSIDNPNINKTVPVPIFYSGGEMSPLPELPCQDEGCLDRVKYAAGVNRLVKDFESVDYKDKDNWEDKFYGIPGDRVEKFYDESRDGYLTVNYYDSDDGVCRTAFASVSNQMHECRHHSIETAWKFISQFTR